jgi:hypothetical protein
VDGGRYRACVNFGFRLPGPFRVGISSKGRVNVGVTAGPFSVSHTLGNGSRGLLLPLTLDQFVSQAQSEGYRVQITPNTSATVERRWQAAFATVVPGRGLSVKRTMSTWQIMAILTGVLLTVVACCGPGFYSASTN